MPRLNKSTVAFVDILGYGNTVCSVKSDAQLEDVLNTVRKVHLLFEKGPTDKLTQDAHQAMKKDVVALSDSVLVAIDWDSDYGNDIGELDLLGGMLNDLGRAQGAAVCNGIFLRGGVALGYHYRDGDVIVSDALVRAYKMESEGAIWPVIALDEVMSTFMRDHADNSHYSHEAYSPISQLKRFTNPKCAQHVYYIDYFSVCWKSYDNPEVSFVVPHKCAIVIALQKPHHPSVKKKFEWMRDYHNDCVNEIGLDKSFRI